MRRPSFLDSGLKAAVSKVRAPSTLDVVHEGVSFCVALKRVGTARRFTLRVRAARRDAVLTMPPRASMKNARNFAERHAAWIGTRLLGLPERRTLGPDALVPLRGVDHRILHDPMHRSLKRVYVDAPTAGQGEHLVLRVKGRGEDVAGHVLAFLRREAHHDLLACVERHSRTIGKMPPRVAIRDTTSRWGSCSSMGHLNFSWRLIMAPPFVLDYLAAHECAHLCHMNHSVEFWALAARLAPQMPAAETWLRTHGAALHLYGL